VTSATPGPGRRAALWRWLQPGVGIKRWLLVVFVGLVLLALAGALIIRLIYRDVPADAPLTAVLELVSLQFLPFELRPVALVTLGLLLFLYGSWRLLRVLLEPYQVRDEPLVELLYGKHWRARGPRIVAIGGGTGLSALLRGLKEHTSNITAIVSVADDGGSSGKLRAARGLPPMGDIRNCIAALADAEPQMQRLLQHRFGANGGPEASLDGLQGHAFGNLLIAALAEADGDFEAGVRQANQVLAVRGRVVPAAGRALTLHAELEDGTTVEGQSLISRSSGISRLWISPADVAPNGEALEAIAAAELIVIGPGSLYTSLLPLLLMPRLRAALEVARAPRLYVCNVATQVGETEAYALSDHLAALERHGVMGLIDAVLANDNMGARQPANYPAAPVRPDLSPSGRGRPRIVLSDVVDDELAHHHDPAKLAAAIIDLLEGRRLSSGTAEPRR